MIQLLVNFLILSQASPVLFSIMEESEELASQLEFASVLNTVDESDRYSNLDYR